MKQQVNTTLLVLFGIISGTFLFTESGFAANVYSRDNTNISSSSVENKSSTFSAKFNSEDSDYASEDDSSLSSKIRSQRAALEKRDTETTIKGVATATQNSCDSTLRKCITTKCGADYSKCATDSDMTFSDKLTACRKDTTCTGHEFTLFVNEIKEDKNQAIRLSNYNLVIECGNKYNDCIISECGAKFNKCLAKSAGDKAIEHCKTIANQCTEADSGMAGRMGSIFGTVRQAAEVQIKADEKKLYSLRDDMRKACEGLGAMFDQRSLDCVFTANFYSGEDQSHPTASKKLYAGSVFDCSPDWFGIDITTFKENAYRLTRSQSAASSAMLGSGLGTAVGAITSGAIDRAIASKKAKNELADACEENGQVLKDGKCVDAEESEAEGLNPEEKCTKSGGTYKNGACACSGDKVVNDKEGTCVDKSKKEKCEAAGGKMGILGMKCKCPKGQKMDDTTGKCITPTNNNDGSGDANTPQACSTEQINQIPHVLTAELKDGKCIAVSCLDNYELNKDTGECEEKLEDEEDFTCTKEELNAIKASAGYKSNGTCIATKCVSASSKVVDGVCQYQKADATGQQIVNNFNATDCQKNGGVWNPMTNKCIETAATDAINKVTNKKNSDK